MLKLENGVDHKLYEDVIWPTLYERVEAFGNSKVVLNALNTFGNTLRRNSNRLLVQVTSSWAGYYEYNTFDQNGIIGMHTEVSNLMLCNGFSGHGLQQSPGAGRAVAELLLGLKPSIDVSCFSFNRITESKPIFEENIV